jgi:3-dehydroquinate dehydratase-2
LLIYFCADDRRVFLNFCKKRGLVGVEWSSSLKSGQKASNCGKLVGMKTGSKGGNERIPSARSPQKVLVLHGPNLNLLGTREPQLYGTHGLDEIGERLAAQAANADINLESFQSNAESDLIERVHKARRESVDFIVINPAAFTHTSVALRDALAAVGIPFIEVHLSNVHAREPFRRHSYFSDIAVGTICGLGARGYEYALAYAIACMPTK